MISIPVLFFLAVLIGLFLMVKLTWKSNKSLGFLLGSFFGSIVLLLMMKQWGASASTFVPTAFILFFLCTVSFVVFKVTKSNRVEKAWMNGTVGATLSHRTTRSGIAIDPAKELLFLQEGSAFKTFLFGDLRGWEKIWLTGGGVVVAGAGLQSAMGAAAANNQARAQNRKGSGLFVKVRDIDHPVWQIQFATAKELDRWFEILSQYVDERKTP